MYCQYPGMKRRGIPFAHLAGCFMFVFLNRFMNMYFVWKALVQEMFLKRTLVVYEKGH